MLVSSVNPWPEVAGAKTLSDTQNQCMTPPLLHTHVHTHTDGEKTERKKISGINMSGFCMKIFTFPRKKVRVEDSQKGDEENVGNILYSFDFCVCLKLFHDEEFLKCQQQFFSFDKNKDYVYFLFSHICFPNIL